MKKLIIGLILCVGFFTGCSCSHKWEEATCTEPMTCSKCGETKGEPLNEEDFMASLSKGLEARWALTTDIESNTIVTKEDWASYFDAEYNEISKYENASFEDKTLSILAKQYIETIIQSKECLPYVNTNQWDSKYTNGIYHDRTEILYKIHSRKPIIVSEENASNLQGLLIDGEVIHVVRDLLTRVKFKKVEDEYGWKTYEAIAENSTTVDFSYFSFSVDLIDKDGVTLTTETASVNNWRAGEKSRFTFNTSVDFEEMDVEYASWNY